jgi:hypothetical protein
MPFLTAYRFTTRLALAFYLSNGICKMIMPDCDKERELFWSIIAHYDSWSIGRKIGV